ncbi:hypothetical protein AMTRI_Chr07g26530 [Amborella trichopoda]
MDENRRIYNLDPCSNIILTPFNFNWCFPHHDYWEDTSTIINGPCVKCGQIIIVHVDSLVIGLAKYHLATRGETVHDYYGEILYEGDTLVTFIYEKSRSSDITQGFPKLTILQSRISLVNKIQKVYQSQVVQIHNRHVETIVRQITSKVLVSEDGMSNVFSPRELIGLLRAERIGPILLGITRASLNTQSFLSKASFQEMTRVLAKPALRGRIDWLKGRKENVALGG